jgi:chromosome partitioning protein
MYQRTNLADQVVAELRGKFGDRVYKTVIPRNVRLSEAPSFGQPITTFDSSSTGAKAYREAAKEIANGTEKRAG